MAESQERMMTKSKHIILRRTDERQSQLDELAALIGKSGPTAAIDFALSFTLAHCRANTPIRRSYAFANWLHNFNAQNGTQYRPTTAPSYIIEQFTATPPAGSGVGEE